MIFSVPMLTTFFKTWIIIGIAFELVAIRTNLARGASTPSRVMTRPPASVMISIQSPGHLTPNGWRSPRSAGNTVELPSDNVQFVDKLENSGSYSHDLGQNPV